MRTSREFKNYILNADIMKREIFKEVINETIKQLSCDDKKFGRIFGISATTVVRWRKGESSPHPFVRKMIVQEIIEQF